MLIFDQLKKNDPQLRLLAVMVFSGMLILLIGLWWVQIVSSRDYQASLETQSVRTIRIPAVRGKIYDRNSRVVAENRPIYNIGLYLDELRPDFDRVFTREANKLRKNYAEQMAAEEQRLGRKLTSKEKARFTLTLDQKNEIRDVARLEVASNVVTQISHRLQKPVTLDPKSFYRHYRTRLALPYPVVQRIDHVDIARFEEQSGRLPGVDLDIQSTRFYPYHTTAAHLIGELARDNSSIKGEEADFSYRLPDYTGRLGIEYAFDEYLHGKAGAKSVIVNNLGYRQAENIWSAAEPGKNVVLTMDLDIQRAAERAIELIGPARANTRAAVVVMDVRTGDILAMVSNPTFNPNHFVQGFPPGEWERVQRLSAEKNRATQENYAPGSIFKTLVALACLDEGLDPHALHEVQPNPNNPSRGIIHVGRRAIKDTCPPGRYNFKRALIHSSNSYFIANGIPVLDRIVELGRRLHLGERIGIGTRQETAGRFPDDKRLQTGWSQSDTANLCIGQGYLDVTPLQMTVLAAAIANGGYVLWPRFVDRIEPQDPLAEETSTVFPKSRVRNTLGVRPSTLRTLVDAMLADVEDPEGSGRYAHIPGFRICAKTGTAEVMNPRNEVIDHTTWFLSFAPYERPRYAVVVMVESGASGGVTCAPIAREIYLAIQQWERSSAVNGGTVARSQ